MAPRNITELEQRERERVGATLKKLHEMRGHNVNEFSEQLGISYSYLSNIEAGRKPLTDRLLARAASVLGVPQVVIKHPDERQAS